MRFVAAILVILALGGFVADRASAEVTLNLQVVAASTSSGTGASSSA
jgi:hypothetical protein